MQAGDTGSQPIPSTHSYQSPAFTTVLYRRMRIACVHVCANCQLPCRGGRYLSLSLPWFTLLQLLVTCDNSFDACGNSNVLMCMCVSWPLLRQEQRPIKVLDAVQRGNRGGYGLGTGCAPPPPLPAHPWCRSAARRKDWAPRVKCSPPLPSHGPVARSPSAPW